MDGEDRLDARINRVEDMIRAGSERASAWANEVQAMQSNITRVLKKVEGNGILGLDKGHQDHELRLKTVEGVQAEVADTYKKAKLLFIGAVITVLVVPFIRDTYFSKQAATQKTQGETQVSQGATQTSQGEAQVADRERLNKLESQYQQIMERLDKALKPNRQRSKPPGTSSSLRDELITNKSLHLPELSHNRFGIERIP